MGRESEEKTLATDRSREKALSYNGLGRELYDQAG